MKMANQKSMWNIRKSTSSNNVVVVENKSTYIVMPAKSVRIQCFSDAKIHVLRGDRK